jgi:hypothetical protein
MKKIFFIALCLNSLMVCSQTIIVPNQLSAQRNADDYQLRTFLKLALEKRGFKTTFESDLSKEELNKPCDFIYADVVEENRMMSTRLKITVADCQKKIISASEFGSSKEKEFKKAYQLAFREAEKSLVVNFDQKQAIEVNPSQAQTTVSQDINTATQDKGILLYAQPIANGYQLINEKPEIICKIFNTSQPKTFIVQKSTVHGIGYLVGDQLTIEYYIDHQLKREVLAVKF